MDFKTYPIKRKEIRDIAKWVREVLFKCKNKYYFDVIKSLELLPKKFNNVFFEILPDNDNDLNCIPAKIVPMDNEKYCIKIKETVYNGAYLKNNGGYRCHIMHEISHFLLFTMGLKPISNKVYKNNELNAYESVEWQAKALAGEVLIPFEATKNMTEEEIIYRCKVSKDAACKRLNIKY